MGVCTPGSDEDGADFGGVREVVGEGFAHGGFAVAGEVEMVFADGEVDEVVHGLEGVFAYYVYGLEFLGELGVVGMVVGGVVRCGWFAIVGVQSAEVED